ncbi:MAG: hypothetical protein CMN33_01200 [Saprospirales bacterium]|nr:hypothetical protein [Saprospirales bacterium]|tara:strand:+ start:11379 stop:11963 length:585 start_codon:yes stop_codon:yes gene_type:complete
MAYVSQEDKAKLAPAIKKVLNKYGMKGSISIRHHRSLVVTLQSGAIDFKDYSHGDGYIQVNTYHIDSHYTGKAKNFLNELLAAMKGPNYFNNDDAMTDYFHRSHYTDINVGRWNKPYFLQETAKKVSKKPVQASKGITVPANASFSNKDTAEDLARMNDKELDRVVDRLVDSYPTLADALMSRIGYAMLDREGV